MSYFSVALHMCVHMYIFWFICVLGALCCDIGMTTYSDGLWKTIYMWILLAFQFASDLVKSCLLTDQNTTFEDYGVISILWQGLISFFI